MNTQKMIMIPVWQYDKMIETYDKTLEELRELKERLRKMEELKNQRA